MKTLLTNGCSWTWGGGFENLSDNDRLETVWPHHLMHLLEHDTNVNLSMGCGSNQRIVRTTLDWILKQDRETLDNTVAVIQWTEPSRYEYYSKTTKPDLSNQWDWHNENDNWSLVKAGCCIYPPGSRNYHIPIEELNDSQMRYRTYSDIEGLYNFITHMAALANIFESYKIKYYYWNALGVPVKYFPNNLKTYASTFNWINNKHDPWDYERISKEDNHPNVNGHLQLAHYIFEEIKSLNNGLL
jgi:hypothetical protein